MVSLRITREDTGSGGEADSGQCQPPGNSQIPQVEENCRGSEGDCLNYQLSAIEEVLREGELGNTEGV